MGATKRSLALQLSRQLQLGHTYSNGHRDSEAHGNSDGDSNSNRKAHRYPDSNGKANPYTDGNTHRDGKTDPNSHGYTEWNAVRTCMGFHDAIHGWFAGQLQRTELSGSFLDAREQSCHQ